MLAKGGVGEAPPDVLLAPSVAPADAVPPPPPPPLPSKLAVALLEPAPPPGEDEEVGRTV